MTLTELRTAHPHLFYDNQDWFRLESFMRALPNDRYAIPPRIASRGAVPKAGANLPLAVELATAYVATPDAPAWRDYLWCRDLDAAGQRVYVGGTANGHGFEIHRHIHISERFGVPSWR